MRWKFEEKQAENLYLMNFYLYTPFQYPVIYSFENGNNKKKTRNSHRPACFCCFRQPVKLKFYCRTNNDTN